MKILGDLAIFESAGIFPSGFQANPSATEVMREVGIDISDHCPRSVSSVNLNDFDLIIAMDSNVNLQLRRLLPNSPNKILSWDINDPWGRNIEDYRKCAEIIKNRLFDLRKLLEEAEGCDL
jgi:protein-tyrosine-phosphatase